MNNKVNGWQINKHTKMVNIISHPENANQVKSNHNAVSLIEQLNFFFTLFFKI